MCRVIGVEPAAYGERGDQSVCTLHQQYRSDLGRGLDGGQLDGAFRPRAGDEYRHAAAREFAAQGLDPWLGGVALRKQQRWKSRTQQSIGTMAQFRAAEGLC